MADRKKLTSTKGDNEGMARRPEVKMSALFALVKTDYENNKRKSESNITYQRKHLAWFDESSAERLRSGDVEQYKDMRLAEGSKRATINLELATLRRALNLGYQRGLIVKVPTITLFPIGNSNRRVGFFEHEDYLKMLAVCRPYQKQVLRFGYSCGWREGEIFNLKWNENYDEAGNCIRIFTSKSGKGRTLPLSVGECGVVIQEQKERRMKNCPYIFHHNGFQLNRNTFGRHWREACEGASVDKHFHDLRRTVVRNLTRAGVPRVVAKMITGHESDNVFERYDIVDDRDLRDALGRMETYINDKHERSAIVNEGNNLHASASRALSPPISFELAEREGFEPS